MFQLLQAVHQHRVRVHPSGAVPDVSVRVPVFPGALQVGALRRRAGVRRRAQLLLRPQCAHHIHQHDAKWGGHGELKRCERYKCT